jgi:AraC-like DNA-binding protein
MNALFEGRVSDSPYIEAVWRGRAGSDYAPVCPASGRWHLLFLKQNGRVNVCVEGPLTKATPVTQAEGTEWFGITFPLGTFLPAVPVRNLLDERAMVSLAAKISFELAGSSFQFPDYDNVETFVERLVREDLLVSDEIVKAVLSGHPPEMSLRTVRRRFLFATGLTYKVISQIERAKQAADLLEQDVSLLDAAYQAGYADQSHMTRSLKHFIGYTPAHIARIGNGGRSESLSILFKTKAKCSKYTATSTRTLKSSSGKNEPGEPEEEYLNYPKIGASMY